MTWRETILRAARTRGMSAYALAKAAELPMRSVQRWVAGTHDIRSAKLERIAAALGLTLKPTKGGR